MSLYFILWKYLLPFLEFCYKQLKTSRSQIDDKWKHKKKPGKKLFYMHLKKNHQLQEKKHIYKSIKNKSPRIFAASTTVLIWCSWLTCWKFLLNLGSEDERILIFVVQSGTGDMSTGSSVVTKTASKSLRALFYM